MTTLREEIREEFEDYEISIGSAYNSKTLSEAMNQNIDNVLKLFIKKIDEKILNLRYDKWYNRVRNEIQIELLQEFKDEIRK